MKAKIQPYVLLAITLAACGGSSGSTPLPTVTASPTASPAGTPTPTRRPTPTPLVAVFYQLTEGSTIISSTGTGVPPPEEPLTGMFIAVPQPKGGQYCLNTLLCLAVTNFQFYTPPVGGSAIIVEGSNGHIIQSEDFPNFISMNLIDAFIGSGNSGQTLNLGGGGPFDPNSPYPPTFGGIEICGAPPGVGGTCADIRAGTEVGYDLTIFAAPE